MFKSFTYVTMYIPMLIIYMNFGQKKNPPKTTNKNKKEKNSNINNKFDK